ncbi:MULTISPECIES: hypothetical protein [Flavobacteriaceae]|uniref:Intradiol ring-cleavage dioxygenases domain-containing protein n=2 Tax=Flavobacteriaceae TaxID=49546 RepID=A0A4Y8ASY4_9FLAO|nr:MULTISPECIES: hypothetical protein [Flavobacteriaceae]TEW73782.1 hypothetical protein E2488_09885 [Gramella jeungdoensis]GGK37501.1 hypothetical protein GCM10007963_02020 [Lutibacter litoralis]
MKNIPSRRLFLRKSAIATTGVLLLSSSSIANTLTNTDSPFDGYNPYSEEKTDLRISTLFGKHLTVKGKIYNKNGTFPLSNAIIEVWHLSPNSTKFKHRAKLKTNSFGEYSFTSDFPNREQGKMPRIYFKISNSETYYFTELVINRTGAHITDKHWHDNQLLKEHLFPITEEFENYSSVTFNISL